MKVVPVFKIVALISILTWIGCSARQDSVPAASKQKPLVVFLVRHGEKADLSRDPDLSVAGQKRAAALAGILRSAEIDYVHSSDFIRTRDTAAPTATAHGLEMSLYDHQDLPALAEKSRRAGGRHLVVGHSNTTPLMVELLGGQPGAEIDEESEFDRLYIVTLARDGSVHSIMMRYGNAYHPEPDQ